MPVVPSSPGAVHVNGIEVDVAVPAAKFVMAAGGVVSAVVALMATLETADQLGTSSAVFIAK